jgi:hypothetical protein
VQRAWSREKEKAGENGERGEWVKGRRGEREKRRIVEGENGGERMGE